MSDSVYILVHDGYVVPAEPVGTLRANGWMAGQWAKITATPTTFSEAMLTIDLSDGTGLISGFLITGPQHLVPVQQLSDMWTTDSRQRAGGETRADWTAFDAGGAFQFDRTKQLQKMGSRVVSLHSTGDGVIKFYVFETLDLAERTTPGTGGPLVYAVGNPLYVSNNGKLTNEKEQVNSTWTEYVVLQIGSDIEGNYLIVGSAVVSPPP